MEIKGLQKGGLDRKFTQLPLSVLKIKRRSEELKSIVGDEFYPEQDDIRSKPTKKNPKGQYTTVGRGTNYSEFSPDLALFLIDFFSEENDLMLDPMMGRGTRLAIARMLRRKSIGVDVCEKFIESAKRNILDQKSIAQWTRPGLNIKKYNPVIYRHDARDMTDIVEDNSVDMVFCCPPYFDIENYPSGTGQLTDLRNYNVFLSELEKIVRENFRVLKQSKHNNYYFCVWVVNNFIKDEVFYPFAFDVHRLFMKNRFTIWTECIHHVNAGQYLSRTWQGKQLRRFAKVHEYIFVYVKTKGSVPHTEEDEIQDVLEWL